MLTRTQLSAPRAPLLAYSENPSLGKAAVGHELHAPWRKPWARAELIWSRAVWPLAHTLSGVFPADVSWEGKNFPLPS